MSADPGLARWTTMATRLLHAPAGGFTPSEEEHEVLGEPVVIADVRLDPAAHDIAELGEPGVTAYLGVPVRDPEGHVVGAFCVTDVEAHEWSDTDVEVMLDLGAGIEQDLQAERGNRNHERLRNILDGHHRIHDLIAAEAPLGDVLEALVLGVEAQTDGMFGSVLLYDPVERCLRHGAAPNLPPEYRAATDGAPIGPDVGSCGSAAFLREEVFVEDIATDPRWADYRDLALGHDLAACWSVPVLDAAGDVLATFGLYYDRPRRPMAGEITLIRHASRLAGIAIERHRSQERLARLATHDPLTGLPNRLLLTDRLDRMLRVRSRPVNDVGVLLCDVNGFKRINDSLGHEAGDGVLSTVAARLLDCVRVEDTVARFGSDEFVIATSGLSTAALSGFADRLVRTLGAPVSEPGAGGSRRTVSVTIGIAVSDAGAEPQDMIRRADAAMHQAERAGVSWAFYEESQQALAEDELRLHSALQGALERGELSAVYQPIFDSLTGRITSVEALMRWSHPELGQVGPDVFIPIAEKYGLIAPMGDWVLRQAVAQGTAWNAGAPKPVSVAVNVSPRQLVDPAFAGRVESILTETRFAPGRLSIEITETALMADDQATVENLQKLHRLGVRIALDDFGTGYSSLSHLRRLPISAVKIDRSFIDGLATEKDDSAIVSGVIGMARGLDLGIVAEGVETIAQAEALRTLSCDFVQGYLFARPLPAGEVTKLLELERRAVKERWQASLAS